TTYDIGIASAMTLRRFLPSSGSGVEKLVAIHGTSWNSAMTTMPPSGGPSTTAAMTTFAASPIERRATPSSSLATRRTFSTLEPLVLPAARGHLLASYAASGRARREEEKCAASPPAWD